MALTDPSLYPKDLTMTLDSNHIQNEIKEFTDSASRIFVPNAGPFFTDSLVIKTREGRDLQPITEFQLLYLQEQASTESNKNVATVIRVLNEAIPAVVLEYRVIGGEYGNTANTIRQEIVNGGPIKNNVDWNIHVYNKPLEYPAAPHRHHANQFTDWDKVWIQLEGIRKAILQGDEQSWSSVYKYIDRKVTTLITTVTYTAIDDIRREFSNMVKASELNNYYTKSQMNNLLSSYETKADNSSKFANYYNKAEVNQLFTGYASKDMLAKAVEPLATKDALKKVADSIEPVVVSPDRGNLLEKRNNGLYYGIEAPADLSNLYVDAVDGNDSNPGSRAAPLRTLDAALAKISPDTSNTIHLKIIPDSHKNTHSYFISRNYWVRGGAVRIIQPYDHSLIDGPDNGAARKLDPNNYWYLTTHVPTVPIWVQWQDIRQSTGATVQEPAKFFINNGTLQFRRCAIYVSLPEDVDNKPVNGYSYRSIFGGSGSLIFQASDMYRIVTTDVNKNANRLADRPAVNNNLTNATFWVMSHGVSSLLVSFYGSNFHYGTYIAKRNRNEFNHAYYGVATKHDEYIDSAFTTANGKDGYNGSPYLAIYTSALSIYNNEVREWGGVVRLKNIPNSYIPSNIARWFRDNDGVHGINWINGVPVNLTTNFPMVNRNVGMADNPNAYKLVNINSSAATRSLLEILNWHDGISDAEFQRLISGMSYHRVRTTALKTLNITTDDGSVFAGFNPAGLQVTLYNATNNEVRLNQTIGNTNIVRTWLPYSAITLIFASPTEIDVIGGLSEE